jgi:HEPN domain-containing protein
MTTDIKSYTIGIVRRMFFDTADLNYISARAAYFDERNWDFWWLTAHAVEKYLKCILLMNGRRATRGGHDILVLLNKVKEIDKRLIPPPAVRPKIAGLDQWHDYPDATFLKRLSEYGSASNRYGAYGYTLFVSDLLRSDQLVYWARRHARPLTQKLRGHGDIDWIEALANSPVHWTQHAGPLEEIARLSPRDSRRWPLMRLNAAFFPDARHSLRYWRTSSNNSPLAEWCERLRSAPAGSETQEIARRVIDWTLSNIYQTPTDEAALRELLAAHPAP